MNTTALPFYKYFHQYRPGTWASGSCPVHGRGLEQGIIKVSSNLNYSVVVWFSVSNEVKATDLDQACLFIHHSALIDMGLDLKNEKIKKTPQPSVQTAIELHSLFPTRKGKSINVPCLEKSNSSLNTLCGICFKVQILYPVRSESILNFQSPLVPPICPGQYFQQHLKA